MTASDRLAMLKADLEIIPQNTTKDEYLTQLLTAAARLLTREGIALTDSIEDDALLVMYAAFLYRKRAEDAPIMPRSLRYAINNRLFAGKVIENV